MTTAAHPETQKAPADEKALARQFVNFMFFRVDRSFRRESAELKAEAKREFAEIVGRYTGPMMVLPYSTVGLKAGVDFMLWRIGYDIDPFQAMVADINRSILGRYLDIPQSYLAMTKHSQYVDEHVHERPGRAAPAHRSGKKPFLFVYPFVKTRDWYLLPLSRAPADHERAHRHRTQVPAREDQHDVFVRPRRPGFRRRLRSRFAAEFLDLVQELRETESSKVHVARYADVHMPAVDDRRDPGVDSERERGSLEGSPGPSSRSGHRVVPSDRRPTTDDRIRRSPPPPRRVDPRLGPPASRRSRAFPRAGLLPNSRTARTRRTRTCTCSARGRASCRARAAESSCCTARASTPSSSRRRREARGRSRCLASCRRGRGRFRMR